MAKPTRPIESVIEPARSNFRKLLAANPNYFGTFPDLGFEPIQPKAGDTSYGQLTCVSYSPERDRLEATVVVKKAFGYRGGLCSRGSFEHVRFYVDYGAGWQDAGNAAINVHDIPVEEDCEKKSSHPLSYVCGVAHQPSRKWCSTPVLPRIRAILSWDIEPPANQPDWTPPWGNVHDCRAQIAPRRFSFQDITAMLPQDVLTKIPPLVLEEIPSPDPDPGPYTPMALTQLARTYAKAKVPAHRFAFAHVTAATTTFASTASLTESALMAKDAGIDLVDVLKIIDTMSGDTSYEEVDCLGLDEATHSLVATFKVKKSSGFSGPPCTEGSTEYVAFWADWDNDCDFEYLGTVKVAVHDYKDIGDGLCYAAILPVDLGAFRQGCHQPALRRVRAVLSWNSDPSTTDPNDVPVWGNILDRHVQLAPGRPYDGTARFTIVGGVAAQSIDLVTGLTEPGAILGTSWGLPNDCAFGGLVVLQGPNDPALAGHQYRIRATNFDGGGSRILISPFTVVTSGGSPVTVTPDPIHGWATWPTWITNTEGVLGVDWPGTNDRWDFTLELDSPGNVVATARVRMDSILRNAIDPTDTVNAGDLILNTAGACKVPHGPLAGTFVARDLFFWHWGISVTGGPGGPIPPIPLTVGISTGTQTPMSGTSFTLNFSDPMIAPCGYVVRLAITDRVVNNSATAGRITYVERGICLEG